VLGQFSTTLLEPCPPGVVTGGGKTIGKCAFHGCASLRRSIVFLGGITTIGSEAFSKCTSLTSIVIPDGTIIKCIDSCVFNRCKALHLVEVCRWKVPVIGSFFKVVFDVPSWLARRMVRRQEVTSLKVKQIWRGAFKQFNPHEKEWSLLAGTLDRARNETNNRPKPI
jgi:BspA type Leucine rich repeat region (6 copies)